MGCVYNSLWGLHVFLKRKAHNRQLQSAGLGSRTPRDVVSAFPLPVLLWASGPLVPPWRISGSTEISASV